MPAYARRSRASLLSVAAPLSAGARALFPDPLVVGLADAVDAAVGALEVELGQRTDSAGRLSAEVLAARAGERSLDRRVGALSRVLDALADFGDGGAEALRLALFPGGARPVVSPEGRAQAAVYRALADRIAELEGHPGAARLQPELGELRADQAAWSAATLAKDDAHREGAARAAAAQAATEALRSALQRLDQAVELLAGGAASAGYAAWARAAQGLG